MAFFHGKAALIKIGAVTIESTVSWSLDVTADTVDTTAMGDDWKKHETGFIDFSASVEGYAKTARATVAQLGVADSALVLYVDADSFFTADTAICTGITETANKDDTGKISYSFAGNDSSGLAYT